MQFCRMNDVLYYGAKSIKMFRKLSANLIKSNYVRCGYCFMLLKSHLAQK